jgi:hypothetical protein
MHNLHPLTHLLQTEWHGVALNDALQVVTQLLLVVLLEEAWSHHLVVLFHY